VPPLALLPPEQLLKILAADGFKVVHEDDFNWWLARGNEIPINLAKEVGEDGCVSFRAMEEVLDAAGIDHMRYLLLKESVAGVVTTKCLRYYRCITSPLIRAAERYPT
jgi:hypothetical protein